MGALGAVSPQLAVLLPVSRNVTVGAGSDSIFPAHRARLLGHSPWSHSRELGGSLCLISIHPHHDILGKVGTPGCPP